MHKVRSFQLVLCADVWDLVAVQAMREFKRVVAEERAGRGFNYRFPELLVISRSRESGPTYSISKTVRLLWRCARHSDP